jgi:hypothetical protein
MKPMLIPRVTYMSGRQKLCNPDQRDLVLSIQDFYSKGLILTVASKVNNFVCMITSFLKMVVEPTLEMTYLVY